MSQASNPDQIRSVYDELARKCADLGVPLWLCDPTGKLVVEPPNAPTPWAQIQPVASAICAIEDPHAKELSPGRWLIPVQFTQASRRLAMNLAILETSDARNATRVATMLQWTCDQIASTQRDEGTIEQFSENLAQAYEETNLLYRMARLLNCGTEPAQSIETIGSQLQQVLPFKWLAIRFSAANHGVKSLAGRTIVSGQPPCEIEMLKTLSDPMLWHNGVENWKKVLVPETDPLATTAGTEVLSIPITHDDKVIGLLLAGNKNGPDAQLSSFEMQFLDATGDFLSVFHENLARFNEQQEMFIGMVQALTASIDAKDRYTRGHSERVGLMAAKMAAHMGMDKATVEQYRIAGLVHDVGKIGVPEAVLTKPGRLTDEEFTQIKLHPGIGYNILKDIPALSGVLPGVLWHHERWDGRGYPDKLAGENIPLIARVLALADTFDAMSSNRSYRPAIPRPKVLEEIIKNGGTQFDPQLAPIFVTLDFAEFDGALEAHRQLDQKAA